MCKEQEKERERKYQFEREKDQLKQEKEREKDWLKREEPEKERDKRYQLEREKYFNKFLKKFEERINKIRATASSPVEAESKMTTASHIVEDKEEEVVDIK